MAVITIYKCDNCGAETENEKEAFRISVWRQDYIDSLNAGSELRPSSFDAMMRRAKRLWCRPCLVRNKLNQGVDDAC